MPSRAMRSISYGSLRNLRSYYIILNLQHVTCIKSFDFSTLCTTITRRKLRNRLTSIIQNVFIFKSGNRRYNCFVLRYDETYFVKEHSDPKNKYSEDDIIKMLVDFG